MPFFLPVPIKLWALSVIATLKLLKSYPAGNHATNLESFKNRQQGNKNQTNPTKNRKAKATTQKLPGILEVKKGETLRSTPLNPHMCSI